MLKSSDIGVWCSIRGSTIIQLYDKKTHYCKLAVDVFKNEVLDLNKVGNSSFTFPTFLPSLLRIYFFNINLRISIFHSIRRGLQVSFFLTSFFGSALGMAIYTYTKCHLKNMKKLQN